MAFQLDSAYSDLQAEATALADVVEPLAVEADAMSEVHAGVHRALIESGLTRVMVPAAYGGREERLDPLAIAVVREVLMGTSSHLDSLFALQGIGSFAITAGGTEEQKRRWLPGVASGETLAALALTEPDVGSDLKALTTELVPSGDGFVLRGRKAFISNAGAAAFYSTLAREGDGFSVVLVPADRDGVRVTATPELIAPHVLGDVEFDDVVITDEDRLGAPGKGFSLVLATLGVFRISVAGASLGLAQAALEAATRHATTRVLNGKPMIRLGEVAAMLADSWTELEASRLLTYSAGERARDDPEASLPYSSMAKLHASEMAGRVVDRAVQVSGRYGLVRDHKIERLYRQARAMRIYEGASEALRPTIARELAKVVG